LVQNKNEELASVQTQLQIIQNDNTILNNQINNLYDENKELKKENESGILKIDSLIKKYHLQILLDISTFDDKIQIIQKQKSQLQTNLRSIETEKEEYLSQLQNLRNEKSDIQTKLQSIQNENEEYLTQLQNLRNENSDIQKKITTFP